MLHDHSLFALRALLVSEVPFVRDPLAPAFRTNDGVTFTVQAEGRSMPSSTAFLVATKAATLRLFRPGLAATRFALVVGPVQLARAVAAAIGSLDFRQIQIDLLKKWI